MFYYILLGHATCPMMACICDIDVKQSDEIIAIYSKNLKNKVTIIFLFFKNDMSLQYVSDHGSQKLFCIICELPSILGENSWVVSRYILHGFEFRVVFHYN